MQTLSELTISVALKDEDSMRNALAYAETFTQRFRECASMPAALREAEMLNLQYPARLLPPIGAERFTGRVRHGLVGISPEACGLGYYCQFDALTKIAEAMPDYAERVAALLDYWRGKTTAEKVRASYTEAVAQTLPSDNWASESGVAFPLYRMAGTVLDYATLLSCGLPGMRTRIEKHRSECASESQREFYTGCLLALDVLRNSMQILAEIAENPDLKSDLLHLQKNPPATFGQAIQLFWLYAIHSGTWNYGRLDCALGPFLLEDLRSGIITESTALDYICDLWKLMHDYTNQYNNRVIIGGIGRSNVEAADVFALLAIKATRRLRLNQPQLSLRVYPELNQTLWNEAIEAIAEGCTFPILYNDMVNLPAVARAYGIPETEAAQYTPYGCGEYVLGHLSQGTPNGVINLLKALEVALHEGKDVSANRILLELPAISDLTTFEKLWESYSKVVDYYVSALAEQEALCYKVTDAECPLLFISMLTNDCLEKGVGAFGGGSRYLGGTIETYGNTNTADALYAINELVFVRQTCTLDSLVRALDANFDGEHKTLRNELLLLPKYGNDHHGADEMASRVHNHVCLLAKSKAANVGLSSYLVVVINNWANTLLGRYTLASADGRMAGEPMANGNNPSPGADRSGVTAFLNSLAKLDPSIHAGAVQNMKFSREWFGKDRPKFEALLKTYFLRGGAQAMITVVSRADLESALLEPAKWGHLLVRVGGFSIRFIDLPEDAQREVLARTLN